MYRIAVLFLATFAATSVGQQPSPVTTPRPTPAPLQVPNPHYVTLLLTQDVNAPAGTVWARVGNYCDIGKWAFPDCKLLAGDGGYASVRNIVNEVLVGKTGPSYTYAQPVRKGCQVQPLSRHAGGGARYHRDVAPPLHFLLRQQHARRRCCARR